MDSKNIIININLNGANEITPTAKVEYPGYTQEDYIIYEYEDDELADFIEAKLPFKWYNSSREIIDNILDIQEDFFREKGII